MRIPVRVHRTGESEGIVIVSVSLDEESEKRLKRIQEVYGLSGRSEAVRLALRSAANDAKDSSEISGDSEGVIVCVRKDHSDPWMAIIQERHAEVVKSLMHSHLKDSRCIDVMIISGDGEEVREMVNEITASGKADYVRFVANRSVHRFRTYPLAGPVGPLINIINRPP